MTEHQPTNMDSLDQALVSMTQGDSFFVEAMTPNDLQIVRRRAAKLGFRVSMSLMQLNDPVFVGKRGTRVWHEGPAIPRGRTKPCKNS